MALSKNRIKTIHALNQKKHRDESHLFVAEGPKIIGEMLPSFHCRYLAGTEEWFSGHKCIKADIMEKVTTSELERISLLTTPQQVLAVFEKPKTKALTPSTAQKNLVLALDEIQDPGNLGTIIRLADWFGIEYIICSLNTADAFSPKTVQATMGALARVNIHYTDLAAFLSTHDNDVPIYGTFLDGKDIYRQELSSFGIVVMGNEGRGISPKLEKFISHKLYIPSFPPNKEKVESLNVSIATAITCAEFRRRTYISHN